MSEEGDWRVSAVCAQVDPEPFAVREGRQTFAVAKMLCARCPVQLPCLEDALSMGPSITGREGGGYVMFQAGFTPVELTALYRRMNPEGGSPYDVLDGVVLSQELVEGRHTSKQTFWLHVGTLIGEDVPPRRRGRERVRETLTFEGASALEELPSVEPSSRSGAAGKLTDEIVLEMRALAATGESASDLARRFEVSRSAAYEAIRGATWKHVGVG